MFISIDTVGFSERSSIFGQLGTRHLIWERRFSENGWIIWDGRSTWNYGKHSGNVIRTRLHLVPKSILNADSCNRPTSWFLGIKLSYEPIDYRKWTGINTGPNDYHHPEEPCLDTDSCSLVGGRTIILLNLLALHRAWCAPELAGQTVELRQTWHIGFEPRACQWDRGGDGGLHHTWRIPARSSDHGSEELS
jgi:hypothetical protein